MKMNLRIILGIITYSLLFCGVAHSVQIGGIKGIVIDTVNGKPIAGATVLAITQTDIESEMKYAEINAETGRDGTFMIKGIRNKGYKITVSKQGFFSYGDNVVYEKVPNESNRIMSKPIHLSSGIAGLDIKSSKYIVDNDNELIWSKNIIFGTNTNELIDIEQQSVEFVRNLNLSKYAGFSDWRLPTADEANAMCHKLAALSSAYPGRSEYPQNVFGMLIGQNVVNWHVIKTTSGCYFMQYNSPCSGERQCSQTGASNRGIWPVRNDNFFALHALAAPRVMNTDKPHADNEVWTVPKGDWEVSAMDGVTPHWIELLDDYHIRFLADNFNFTVILEDGQKFNMWYPEEVRRLTSMSFRNIKFFIKAMPGQRCGITLKVMD